MKNIFAISILTILITTQVHSQKKMSAYNVKKYGDKWYADNEDTPFTGIMFLLDESTGVKTHESHFKNGLRNGLRTEWNKNGIKIAEGSYKNGKREGKHLTTIESGKGQYIINYLNDKPDYNKVQYKDLATGIIGEGRLANDEKVDKEDFFKRGYILWPYDDFLNDDFKFGPNRMVTPTATGTILITNIFSDNVQIVKELDSNENQIFYKEYYENGQIAYHEQTKGKNKIYLQWYQNGQMLSKIIKDLEGNIIESTEWDENGKIINQE